MRKLITCLLSGVLVGSMLLAPASATTTSVISDDPSIDNSSVVPYASLCDECGIGQVRYNTKTEGPWIFNRYVECLSGGSVFLSSIRIKGALFFLFLSQFSLSAIHAIMKMRSEKFTPILSQKGGVYHEKDSFRIFRRFSSGKSMCSSHIRSVSGSFHKCCNNCRTCGPRL